jgi:hypothetical protein
MKVKTNTKAGVVVITGGTLSQVASGTGGAGTGGAGAGSVGVGGSTGFTIG